MADDLLNPPLIEGALPAFYGKSFYIPFKMNSTVGENEISGFQVKIKTIQGNEEKINIKVEFSSWKKDMGILEVNIGDKKSSLKKGSSYKIQLAYINKENIVGLFSKVSIIKYLGVNAPTVTVDEGSNTVELIGTYKIKETSEKLYSSYFIVRDSLNNIVHRTEEKIHNVNNDTIASGELHSQENFVLDTVFITGKNYYATFYCKTINGLELESEEKMITLPGQFIVRHLNLNAKLDSENGRVQLILTKTSSGTFLGEYVLARQDLRHQGVWSTVFDLNLNGVTSPTLLWYDNTIEHGVSYQYAIFKKGEEAQSEPITSEVIYASFEDMFLSDGDRQLRIRFNPKVSSIKNVIQEQKLETMGSKYPYFFRNGYINYRELPVSGLISYHQDEDNLFFDKGSNFNLDELGNYKTVNLTDDNVYNERIFKMEVLNWLSNGKPKVFRSPSEGNYIVRLMNISLSPLSDGLSRMLHTFSSTAYEINEFNFKNLLEYELIRPEVINSEELKIYQVAYSLSLLNTSTDYNLFDSLPSGSKIISLEFKLSQGTSRVNLNGVSTIIFNNFTISNIEFNSLKAAKKNDEIIKYQGNDWVTIRYQSENDQWAEKNKIKAVKNFDIPCYQIFGRGLTSGNLLLPFDVSKLYNRNIISIEYIRAYIPQPVQVNNLTDIIYPGILYLYQGGYYVKDSLDRKKYLLNGVKNPEFKINYTNYQGNTITQNLNFSQNKIEISEGIQSIYASPGVIVEVGVNMGQYEYNENSLTNNAKASFFNFIARRDSFINTNSGKWVEKNIIDYASLSQSGIDKQTEFKHPVQDYGDRMILSNNNFNDAIKGGK